MTKSEQAKRYLELAAQYEASAMSFCESGMYESAKAPNETATALRRLAEIESLEPVGSLKVLTYDNYDGERAKWTFYARNEACLGDGNYSLYRLPEHKEQS